MTPDIEALSVSALTEKLRQTVEPAFRSVWLKGEISNYRGLAPSGHLYFSLKDPGAVLSAACFGAPRMRGWSGLASLLKDGVEVLVHGRVTLYPPRGSYQLTVDQIQPLGAGLLQAKFDALKRELEAEGVFRTDRKRALPALAETVGIITSPGAAALQDFLHTLDRRAPWIKVRVFPSLVQGEQAPRELCAALALVQKDPSLDVVVLARGGGSLEDLWAFNDPDLVRAIAASRIPVISAVGHEVDTMLSDYAADLRAATPTAAAEILSTPWARLPDWVMDCAERAQRSMRRLLQLEAQKLDQLGARLLSPAQTLELQKARTTELAERLCVGMSQVLRRDQQRLSEWARSLEALSPLQVLARGYAVARDEKGQVLSDASQARPGQMLRLTLSKGELDVSVVT